MDNDLGALTPAADDILPVMDDSELVENAAIDDAAKEEEALGALAGTTGWQKIATKMSEDIEGFRTGQGLAITPDMGLAEVGQKFIIASTIATKLQEYLDMVNSAEGAVRERRNSSAN